MNETVKFFVYGTLKKGGRLSGGVAKFVQSVKEGTIKGRMYDVGSFPAVLLNNENTIHGEIHEFSNPADVHMLLDRIEGYYGEGNKQNLYNKEQVEVTTTDGTETCYVYEFNRPVDSMPEIKSGVWEI